MQSTQIQPFQEVHRGEEVFSLGVQGEQFGFLYVTPASSTLIWNGAFDFSKVETEALSTLSSQISGGQDILWPDQQRTRNATSVYLALENDSSFDFDLKKDNDLQRYKQALQVYNRISFIRYDIQDTATPLALTYSFTAKNPRWLPHPTDNGELTIKLPNSWHWSARILKWATEHHAAYATLKNTIDLQATSNTLSELSHAGKS
jgi:hypothetical protein